MSQNIIRLTSTSGLVEVCAGWDNPLREVFCNVLALGDSPELEELLSGLDEETYSTAEDVKIALKKVGIDLPPSVVDFIQFDIDNASRNILRKFSEAGVLEEELIF